MSDNELNQFKKKERVFVMPTTMNKYSADTNQLLELRAGYEAKVESIKALIKRDKELTATNGMRNVLIGEAEFQIKMIDKLLQNR